MASVKKSGNRRFFLTVGDFTVPPDFPAKAANWQDGHHAALAPSAVAAAIDGVASDVLSRWAATAGQCSGPESVSSISTVRLKDKTRSAAVLAAVATVKMAWLSDLRTSSRLAKHATALSRVRSNEGIDDGRGKRRAKLAAELRGDWLDLPDAVFDLLYSACAHHTDGLVEADITIQTCWDGDRLDLGRVGIIPAPMKLCTGAAKTWEIIQWADGRAAFEVVPGLVKDEWGIDLRRNMDPPHA